MSFATRFAALAVLVAGTAVLLTSVHSPRASAAVPKGMYEGVASDMGAVEIEVDGLSIVAFRVAPTDPPVPNQCPLSARGIGESVGGGTFTIGNSIVDANGLRTDVNYTGFIDANGFASGTAKAIPTSNNPCVARSVTWAAVLEPGTALPAQSATFSGSTDKGGTVTFRTTSNNALTAFSLIPASGCQPVPTGPGVNFTLAANVVNLGDAQRTLAIRIFVAGDRAVGAFSLTPDAPSKCQALVGTFSAKVGAAPTATPTPAPSSGGTGGVVGSIPAAGAAGLLVSGGATSGPDLVSQLGSRGCTVASLGVLRSGTWSIFIPGAPAVVNSAFPSSLAASTPFYVRCG